MTKQEKFYYSLNAYGRIYHITRECEGWGTGEWKEYSILSSLDKFSTAPYVRECFQCGICFPPYVKGTKVQQKKEKTGDLPKGFTFDQKGYFATASYRLIRDFGAQIVASRIRHIQKDFTVCEIMDDSGRKGLGIAQRKDTDKWDSNIGKFYASQAAINDLRRQYRNKMPLPEVVRH